MFSTTEADFSGIPKGGKAKLSVSEVIQKAYISVDEEGTEAAAATGFLFRIIATNFRLIYRSKQELFIFSVGRYASRSHVHAQRHGNKGKSTILLPNCGT